VGAVADVGEGFVIHVAYAVFAAGLDGHVGQGHAVFEGEAGDAIPREVHGAVGGPIHADLADDGQDQVLGGEVGGDFAPEGEFHGGGDLEPELAGAQDKARIGVADAGGELAE